LLSAELQGLLQSFLNRRAAIGVRQVGDPYRLVRLNAWLGGTEHSINDVDAPANQRTDRGHMKVPPTAKTNM